VITSYSITISCRAEKIFDFMADMENDLKWNRAVASSKRISETKEAGAEYERSYKGPFGMRVPAMVRVTEYDRPRKLVFRSIVRGDEGIVTAVFEEVEGGTRIVRTEDLFHKGVFAYLSPLMASSIRRGGIRSLQTLKKLLESPA